MIVSRVRLGILWHRRLCSISSRIIFEQLQRHIDCFVTDNRKTVDLTAKLIRLRTITSPLDQGSRSMIDHSVASSVYNFCSVLRFNTSHGVPTKFEQLIIQIINETRPTLSWQRGFQYRHPGNFRSRCYIDQRGELDLVYDDVLSLHTVP